MGWRVYAAVIGSVCAGVLVALTLWAGVVHVYTDHASFHQVLAYLNAQNAPGAAK